MTSELLKSSRSGPLRERLQKSIRSILKPKVQPDSKAVCRAEPSETAVYQPRERVERRSRTYTSSDRFSDHLFRRWLIGCRLRKTAYHGRSRFIRYAVPAGSLLQQCERRYHEEKRC